MIKKSCPRCGKNSREKYNFCPYCGNPLERKKKDLGMLGETDSSGINLPGFGAPTGFNSILNSLMRNLEKQYKGFEKKEEKKDNFPGVKGISISISAPGMFPHQMAINKPVKSEEKHKEIKKFSSFSPEKFDKYSKLPKKEPKTNIRRLSNKVIYEVELPGVKSLKDVSIVRLEKGVELKALADKKGYAKTISLDLPILNYKLSEGKLVLEMDTH